MNISKEKESGVGEGEFIAQCLRLMPLMMRAMMRREANDLASGAMSLPQYGVLDFLRERGEATMHEIAETLSIKPSNLTGIMDRLVALNLVERFNDDRDRRAVLARITPEGEAALGRITDEKRATLGSLYRCISPKERRVYLTVMEKFVQELTQP